MRAVFIPDCAATIRGQHLIEKKSYVVSSGEAKCMFSC